MAAVAAARSLPAGSSAVAVPAAAADVVGDWLDALGSLPSFALPLGERGVSAMGPNTKRAAGARGAITNLVRLRMAGEGRDVSVRIPSASLELRHGQEQQLTQAERPGSSCSMPSNESYRRDGLRG